MKKLIPILFLAVFFALSSCGLLTKKIEKDFCDKILSINDTLDNLNSEWLTGLNSAMLKKEYSQLNEKRIIIGKFIGRNRVTVAEAKANASLEFLRTEELTFLSSQADIVADSYPIFEQFSEYTPDTALVQSLQKVSDNIKNCKSAINKVKDDIRQYSAQNKLDDIKQRK